ncbi:N/A [soil metagenome]
MPTVLWRRVVSTLSLVVTLAASAAAAAAPRQIAFHIAPQPLPAALVQVALQAGVSMSTREAVACGAAAHGLVGRYSLEAALTRLLSGTGCGYRLIDEGAVEIVRLARPVAVRPGLAENNPTEAVSELIVVATRRATQGDRLAYPVSAQDEQTLAALGVRDASDLALTTPAMTVTNLGPGRDKILLRGLSDGPLTGRTQSMVGIYLDDVRLTYNAPDPDLRLTDMAQVEVLRGPQGALYGAGSLGGVLHLVTAAPDPDALSAWVSASASATNGGGPSSVLEGMLNLPLAGGRGAARLTAYREIQGGYIDDSGLGLSNVNRALRNGLRLTGRLELGDRWTLTGGIVSQAINSDDTQYALASEGAYRRLNQVREPHDNDFAEAHLNLGGRFDWGDVHASTAMIRHDVASRYDATSAPPLPMPPGPVAFDDEDSISSLVAEATVTSPAQVVIPWLAGAFLARTRQDIGLRLSSVGAAPVTGFQEDRHDRLDEAAIFGQAEMPLSPSIRLTLGGRLFFSDGKVTSAITAPLAGTASAYSGRARRTGFAPKVVISYAPSPGRLFYVQAAEGYRAGGVNTTGAPGQVFNVAGGLEPDRFYQGDELWSVEAGGRFSLLRDRLTVRGAVFEAFWSNIQSDQLLPSALPFTANIGDGRNRGIEVETTYRDGSLVLRGEVLVNSPELDRANPAFPARADLSLAGAPGVSGGVSASYAWRLPGGRSLELDGRYSYVGVSRLTFDAATSPKMGDYAIGRISGSLVADRWRVSLAVDNLADSRGDTFAYGNPFTLRTTRQLTPLPPRTISLALRMSY